MNTYTPTFLYIKRHRVTGLLYFGKTINNPLSYKGSGVEWCEHCDTNSWDVETLWYCLYTEREELVNFAIKFSVQEDIVRSKLWANRQIENGRGGAPAGCNLSEEQKAKISNSLMNHTVADSTRKLISDKLSNRKLSEEHKESLRGCRGPRKTPRSSEHNKKIGQAQLGKKRGPYKPRTT